MQLSQHKQLGIWHHDGARKSELSFGMNRSNISTIKPKFKPYNVVTITITSCLNINKIAKGNIRKEEMQGIKEYKHT